MNLQYSGVLQTVAEVSITLAGFIGVILVLRNETSREENRLDSNEMFHMLLSSLGVCGLAFLPLISQSVFTEQATIWRLCTPVMGAIHLFGASRGLRDYWKGELGLSGILISIFAPVSYLLAFASVAVLLGYWVEHAPAFYLVGLGWSLIVAASTFLTLVFRRGGSGDTGSK